MEEMGESRVWTGDFSEIRFFLVDAHRSQTRLPRDCRTRGATSPLITGVVGERV